MKSARSNLTRKAIRLLPRAATKLVEYGRRKTATKYRHLMDMKTKSSRAPSTTRETQLLQVQRTTRAEFGKTNR